MHQGEQAMTELSRILYAEDEADIREIALMALEDIGGFTVQACESGHEALDKAVEFKPDLILLDVMMPNLDGPATLDRLKKMQDLSEVPVIFMTAKVQLHEIEHLKSLGAMDVIPKPFDPMTLSDQIRDVWNQIK